MADRLWPDMMRDLAALFGPSADEYPRVGFQGKQYFLIGDVQGGAIATREQYENGECSFAHLCHDGRIMRFNEQIGTRDDLMFLAPVSGQAEGHESTNGPAAGAPDVAPAEGLGAESSAALREGE